MSLDVAAAVMASFAQIDHEIDTFQQATRLQCPPGCGACCENPDVEATPLEMLPLVLELFQRGEIDQWLDLAEAADYQGRCIFYNADPVVPGNGRCQVYQWRPTLCRLFGFATVTQKSGQVELAACLRHKAVAPGVVAEAQRAIANGLVAPSFADISQQIANLDPTLGTLRLPINRAFVVAVEKVGLWLHMTDVSQLELK